MDLLTPATTWAAAPAPTIKPEIEPAGDRMPLVQRVVMFISVVGPFVGLLVGVVLLWRRNLAGSIGWPAVFTMMVMYALAGFGVTLGYHRLLTHKAFDTPRPMRLLLAILGSAAAQGMAIKWVATHRRHHQSSDREGDPHSPHLHGKSALEFFKGFWHAHVLWCFDADGQDLARSVPDLLADKALLLIDRLYFLWVALGLILPGVALGWYTRSWAGFVSGLLWGGLVRVFLMQHVTWSINSVCHVWGRRPFKSLDHSANNFPLAIVSLGEGWHNNHHAFPTSARHGLKWWEFDASFVVLKAMSWVGLARNLRVPTRTAIEAKLA